MQHQLQEDIRQEVLERYNYRCQFCGVTEDQHKDERGRGLDIHHIIPRRMGGDDTVKNLISVCVECHRTLESTQGDAIEQMKENLLTEDEYEDKVKELEKNLEVEVRQRRMSNEDLMDTLNGIDELIYSSIKVTVYVVHQTKFDTSELLYAGTDSDRAYEVFRSSENHSTMETSTVVVGDWLDSLPDQRLESAVAESEELEYAINENGQTRVCFD